MIRFRQLPLLLLSAIVFWPSMQAHARVIRTFPEAVQSVFPQADKIKRQSIYLTPDQLKQASALAREPVATAFLVVYRISRAGKTLGWAYLDTHRVRTLNETVLICIDLQQRILHIEQLSFAEPQEYMASDRFIEQFRGKRLDADLSLKGSIPSITGSTLTCSALTSASRRVLALHQVVLEHKLVAQ
jgi:Na+-translocating ferredoxin:NAD+ oxidoreductase subunit G